MIRILIEIHVILKLIALHLHRELKVTLEMELIIITARLQTSNDSAHVSSFSCYFQAINHLFQSRSILRIYHSLPGHCIRDNSSKRGETDVNHERHA